MNARYRDAPDGSRELVMADGVTFEIVWDGCGSLTAEWPNGSSTRFGKLLAHASRAAMAHARFESEQAIIRRLSTGSPRRYWREPLAG
jgi:hypothetical protein